MRGKCGGIGDQLDSVPGVLVHRLLLLQLPLRVRCSSVFGSKDSKFWLHLTTDSESVRDCLSRAPRGAQTVRVHRERH